ncbi:hypothetical protein S83_016754 [Arachis hypogaea]
MLQGESFKKALTEKPIQANGSSIGLSVPNLDIDTSSTNVKILTEMAEEMLKQKNVESVLLGGKRISEQSNSEKLDWFAEENLFWNIRGEAAE